MDAGKQLRTAVFLARKAPFVLKAGLRQTFKKLPTCCDRAGARRRSPVSRRPVDSRHPPPHDARVLGQSRRGDRGDPPLSQTVGHRPTASRRDIDRIVDGRTGRGAPAGSRPPRGRTAGRGSTGNRRPGRRYLRARPSLPGRVAVRCRSLTDQTRISCAPMKRDRASQPANPL